MTEEQCAEACFSGGWQFYVWNPDAECALIGGWWVCVQPDLQNCCQCLRVSGTPDETDCYEGGFDQFACEEILIKDGLVDWDECAFHEMAACLDDDTCASLQPPEACCLVDGTCVDLDPIECELQEGIPQGPGSLCTGREGCCLPDGVCLDLDPLCCDEFGGTPQGSETACVDMTIGCCLPDGACVETDPLCCDDVGGEPSPIGEPHCLGDANGNGVDDACEWPAVLECPLDTLFAQPAHSPSDPWVRVVSDYGYGTWHTDNFALSSSPEVCDIHWWGFHAYEDPPGNWVECYEDPATFQIVFTDASGGPGCAYTVTVEGVPTGILYDGIELWAYETILDPCCLIENGTVSIVGAGPDDNCWFLWLSARIRVDGRMDILTGNTAGELLLYRNKFDDADLIFFSEYLTVRSDGIPINLPGDPRSRPFVCDWTDDGVADVLIGVKEDGTDFGRVHLYQGASEPGIVHLGPEEVVTAAGAPIEVPGWSVPSLVHWDGDGLKDLVIGEGGGGYDGKVRVYLNQGMSTDPQFSAFFYAVADGSEIFAPAVAGCMGAFPRVVYWDADEKKDLVVGQPDGTVMLFTNVGTDDDPIFDAGVLLEVGEPGLKVPIDVGLRATPTIVDFNSDGKKDLVVGALEGGLREDRGREVLSRDEGKIHVFINEGTDTEPDFRTHEFARLDDGTDLSVPSGRSSPVVCDLIGDGDGLCWGATDMISWEEHFDLNFCLTGGIQACCLPDGECTDVGPETCVADGGVPQGLGTECTQREGCCLPDGLCLDLDPLCCEELGGTPQGGGTGCVDMTIACCLPDGGCADVDPLCCDDLGGMPMGMESDCQTTECSPLKWIQLPDLTENGIDVCLGRYQDPLRIVADDFECTEMGLITDVHLWGSWKDDLVGEIIWIHLSIHSDDPVGPGGSDPFNEFSKPDELLWERDFAPDEFSMVHHGEVFPPAWWWDPHLDELLPGNDSHVWRVDIDIDPAEAFLQRGGAQDPTIYWVDVRMETDGGEFGLKTREWPQHYMDDAVWDYGSELPRFWEELRYPPGHPYHGLEDDSIDLAFALTSVKVELVPKWAQFPHYGGEGFDAASNLWWYEPELIKWVQPPDPSWPGLPAHDSETQGTLLADQWECEGGAVTLLRWYGNYELDALGQEIRGTGITSFHLSFHNNVPFAPWCLPEEPPFWTVEVPFDEVGEVDTGMVNNEGSTIYLYEYRLPDSFLQTPTTIYWLDIMALSGASSFPPAWRWQEAGRNTEPILCPAAWRHTSPASSWESVAWPDDDTYSDLAFEIISELPVPPAMPNKVVADDFISDGRPIEALTWWGSYLDPQYEPDGAGAEPFVLDGWLISFHHADPDIPCPPEPVPADVPTALGVYFAPVDAVAISGLFMADCFGHRVFHYEVDLDRCCLLCAEADPRLPDLPPPARPHAFLEEQGYTYWLDIQAVTGVTWHAPACGPDDRILTGHLPSPITPEGHFWGWHTSPDENLEQACSGEIIDLSPYPPDCWDYGNWGTQPWLCDDMPPFPPVHMAFTLLTTGVPGDCTGDWLVDLADYGVFAGCMTGPEGGSVEPECGCADVDRDGDVDLVDFGLFQAVFDTP